MRNGNAVQTLREWMADLISVTNELLRRDDRDTESEIFLSGRLDSLEDCLEQIDDIWPDGDEDE